MLDLTPCGRKYIDYTVESVMICLKRTPFGAKKPVRFRNVCFIEIFLNLDSRANFFLALENLIGPFISVAFPPLIFREAPYRGPSVREKERLGVEVEIFL